MTAATLGPSPGNARDPEHAVIIRPAGGRWSVSHDGTVLAQSSEALLLEESGYGPVVYFPPTDVVYEQLVASDTRTRCPFKGEARYYAVGPDGAVDVAWCYPQVYDEVAPIAAHVAFYADRVVLEQDR